MNQHTNKMAAFRMVTDVRFGSLMSTTRNTDAKHEVSTSAINVQKQISD